MKVARIFSLHWTAKQGMLGKLLFIVKKNAQN